MIDITSVNITSLIILGLATHRLASLISTEKGPILPGMKQPMFIWLRDSTSGHLSEGLNCLWCVSVWMATVFFLAFMVVPIPAIIFTAILAISDIALLAEAVISP